ncbi:recombinase family protein [Bacillus paralicheniformis]|uniref:recombinase family protein n=1 Tax=Bacillus TaxID=1386 RepID=UPI0013EF123F|nr:MULTISPECIES: recombinase family protein [Bacillus]MCY8609944.1 recombinase family protein [Bacillus haynesii]MEC0752179.1 recombinase family protein [Bacillus haynesii]QII49529.1 recombinase family protein [Bacillus paralicheniformis]
MRAALYYRVSTKMQEHKYSLKAQKEELRKYAEAQGWTIAAEFKDVETGGKLDKSGLNALLDFIEEGSCDVVLCIDQDRLSRLDTVAWEFLKSALRDNNVKIAEPGSITDLDNEDEEFVSDIKNLMARREKRKIVRRMMRGKRQRTREGKGWGKTPMEYNYDKNTGTYSINSKWSWIIPFIDDLYLNKGYSYKKIAKELNKITPTPNGKKWSDTAVKSKLRSKAYHGVMEKTFANGETISKSDIYPKLRTEETYDRIQEMRKEKFTRKTKENENPQLLRRTFMTCGLCGRKLTIHMSGTKKYGIHFYITHGRPERQRDNFKCDLSINVIRVEKNIVSAIKNIIKSEELAKEHIKMDFDENDASQLKKDIKEVKKLIADVNEKKDRLLPLYLDGQFPKEQLDKQHNFLTNELKTHEKRLKQLKTQLTIVESKQLNYDLILEYFKVAERFDTWLTKEEQMNMIGQLFPKATVFEEEIIMHGELPNGAPLEINVPIDPNPFDHGATRPDREIDPWGKYQKIQEMMRNNPGMPQSKIAEKLNIAPSTIVRLKKKFGEFEGQVKAIEHDPEGKREKLEQYLKKNPNASLRQTARDTGMSTTTVRRIKEKFGLK